MACGDTLYTSSGWDWSSIFIVQNDNRGYPPGEYGKLVDSGPADDVGAVSSGTGTHAGKGGTDRLEVVSQPEQWLFSVLITRPAVVPFSRAANDIVWVVCWGKREYPCLM